MEYNIIINGIKVQVAYRDEDVRDIFIPLLKQLEILRAKKRARILVMLAAPPGAGKSTLASFFEHLAKDVLPDTKVQAIGMDGFHMRQEYLLSHKTEVRGRNVRLVEIKGAPVTFDFDGLKTKVAEVAAGKTCGWPIYDRMLHNPVEDASKGLTFWNPLTRTEDYKIIKRNCHLLRAYGTENKSNYAVQID